MYRLSEAGDRLTGWHIEVWAIRKYIGQCVELLKQVTGELVNMLSHGIVENILSDVSAY